uniref:uncharacterized protein LOC122579060 n=1 Tax=Erigeron canadensis TaxID=72917 RepID=UPI001CB96091|nr:uncharacterized protein LOC122579060 [Erigeron canadensis]
MMMQKESLSFITEENVSLILQRYSPSTILTLLQEVAQVQDVKIDWNALVKYTKTGITNPREYQILWRHLAYCDPLLEKLEAEAQPLDDDSDLECELQAFPNVSNEASAEAAACVKVLMDSGSPNHCIEKGLTMEAPMTINIPRPKSTQPPSENPQFVTSLSGINISVPIYIPKPGLPTVPSAEGLDAVDCTDKKFPPKRKRKAWSEEEDQELIAAVQKSGEGNWANMLKGDFKSDRTPIQLSQRWNTIKKSQRYTVMNSGSQLSKAQLAARRALNIALDNPRVTTPKVPSPLGRTNPVTILVQPPVADPPFSTTLSQSYDSAPTGLKRVVPRPQPFLTKPLASGPDAVKAAAVAAGARIATPKDAAAIMKQQMKSTIHIKTTRSPSTPRAHMASDYFRAPYSRLSPNAPRSNTGSTLPKLNVGAVIQLNQFNKGQDMNVSSEIKADHVVTISSSAHSPDPVQNDKVVVSGNHEVAFSNQDARLGSMDLDQQAQPPGSSNPPNANYELSEPC